MSILSRFRNRPVFLRWLVTMFIYLIMGYCLITTAELFPFAPYTMYSGRYSPQSSLFYKIYVSQEDTTPVELTVYNSHMIAPFDETRLETALLNARKPGQSTLDSPELRLKLREVLVLVNKNTHENYDSIWMNRYNVQNLDDLRKMKLTLIEEIREKIN